MYLLIVNVFAVSCLQCLLVWVSGGFELCWLVLLYVLCLALWVVSMQFSFVDFLVCLLVVLFDCFCDNLGVCVCYCLLFVV